MDGKLNATIEVKLHWGILISGAKRRTELVQGLLYQYW